jgi:hypothetical protein
MKVDLAGKIKETQLPRAKALLPMFEAVVNSLQAIEDARATARRQSPTIDILVNREAMLQGHEADGEVIGFVITDNGTGFGATNLNSFFTEYTMYKASRGGKGVGRFLWLKAFQFAEIESHFWEADKLLKQAFKFTVAGEEPSLPASASDERLPRTTVRLVGMRSPYKESCPRGLELIGHQLVEHCLPFFIDPQCPAISIRDDRERIDLNKYFRDTFASSATRHDFKVGGTAFRLTGLRLYNPHDVQHRLLYAANFREVLAEKLEKYLPNLQKKRLIESDGTKFVYLGFVEGDYLDQHVNSERTGFTFAIHRDNDDPSLYEELSLDAIRNEALGCVSVDLKDFLDEINVEKRSSISSYINHEAPQYRPLMRYMDEFIDRITPGASGRVLEAALHEQMYEKQRQLKDEGHELFEESSKQALKPEEYESKLNSFLERANELGKSSLAQYVAHRKVILDFLEKSLQSNPETGKYPLEEIIHKIIYPMRTSSDDVPYEQQNLWIIDERLSYHGFLASDMPLNSVSVLSNSSESRPDIMIFDRALSFAEDDGPLNSIVIVEFKKPARSDYRKEDPVDQVYRLIREIKGGHFKDKNGVEIKVQSDRIPAYAYIICDTTKEVEIIAENKALLPTPDNLGYFGYNQRLSVYVEIISYTKLLRDAKKRNRILFDKLHLPIHST